MPTTKIKIEGFEQLKKNLVQYPKAVGRRALHSAVLAGAKVVVKAGRANAPVLKRPDPRRVAGAIKRNIVSQKRTRGVRIASMSAVGVDSGKVPKANSSGRIETKKGKTRKKTSREKRNEDPFYWKWVEFDHRAVGPGHKGESGTLIPGKKFLTKAFTSNRQAIVTAMREKLRANIAKIRSKK